MRSSAAALTSQNKIKVHTMLLLNERAFIFTFESPSAGGIHISTLDVNFWQALFAALCCHARKLKASYIALLAKDTSHLKLNKIGHRIATAKFLAQAGRLFAQKSISSDEN